MHNNIMATGSRDHLPMLAMSDYAQWRSRFLRYIHTRPNGDALKKCILEGPYTPTTVVIQAVPATKFFLAVPKHTTVMTILNMSPKNKAHFESEKEAIHLILSGIGDEIYSTLMHARQLMKCRKLLKGYNKEVNEFRAERIAKTANPLALVATAQPHQDPYYQTSNKEIAKPITPPSELASEEDNDPEQAQKYKEMQKNLPLIAKYFKKIYKPTKNNLITSSNTKNKSVDTTLRYKNDNQTRQFRNQRTMTIPGAKETVGGQPKRVKDYAYHKEKMLLCKQAKNGVPLQAEQSDWLADMDEEIDEQELENDQNVIEYDDERVTLANLIANLKLDCKLLEVGSPFFWQWEHPPLAVGTYTANGNSLLAVGMDCAFYS
nr:hypothetical protein [Tanacetum cinerariifolium]